MTSHERKQLCSLIILIVTSVLAIGVQVAQDLSVEWVRSVLQYFSLTGRFAWVVVSAPGWIAALVPWLPLMIRWMWSTIAWLWRTIVDFIRNSAAPPKTQQPQQIAHVSGKTESQTEISSEDSIDTNSVAKATQNQANHNVATQLITVNVHEPSTSTTPKTESEMQDFANDPRTLALEFGTEIATEVIKQLRDELHLTHAEWHEIFEQGKERGFTFVLHEQMAQLKSNADSLRLEVSIKDHRATLAVERSEKVGRLLDSMKQVLDFEWFSNAASRYAGAIHKKYELIGRSHEALTADHRKLNLLVKKRRRGRAVHDEEYSEVFDAITNDLSTFVEQLGILNDNCLTAMTTFRLPIGLREPTVAATSINQLEGRKT